MSGTKRSPDLPGTGESIELTQTLKRLTVPVKPANDPLDGVPGTALLLSRDKEADKWGKRWLTQAGFSAEIPAEPIKGLEIARAIRPDVIIVDAALRDLSGTPV